MIETMRMTSRTSRTLASSWNDATRVLVGGVDSPVRAFRHVGGDPLMVTKAQGARMSDGQGRAYRDFIMGWGALMLGHNPSVVTRTIRQAATRSTVLGLTHPAEVELARLIVEAVPSVEQVRFTVSGTEACMTAVRLARAHTGRTHVLTFDGAYHGHGDTLMAGKTAGIPAEYARHLVTAPFNDLGAFEEAVARRHDTLACVIVEPVAANTGVIPPAPGWLQRLRALTSQHGILLIFDEVVTGFRLARGGAQETFGVTPDLTTFGKIIGGGLPIGALGGPRRLMQRLAPEGDVYHGGTFAGHPLSMAAGVATLQALRAHPPYARLASLTQELVEGLRAAAGKAGVPVQINVAGSMFTVFFTQKPVRNAAHVSASRRDQFAIWSRALRQQGILIPPSPYEALFLSTAHRQADVDAFVRAARAAFAAVADGAHAA